VLRHWEDVGVLVPRRTASGHRRYDQELLTRARLIRLCQHAGLSLADIRRLGVGDREKRIAVIDATLERIRSDVAKLQRAERFLSHVVTCVHPMVSECPDCAGFAGPSLSSVYTVE
jgi:MerR family copper efflux transcriptional regulator